MMDDENVGDTYYTKTNSLPVKSWRYVIHDDLMKRYNRMIVITENTTWLWKRYVAKQYKDGKLIASYPADKLCEIDLLYFVK